MSLAAWLLYAVAFVLLVASIWRQVSKADRAEAELERRKNAHP